MPSLTGSIDLTAFFAKLGATMSANLGHDADQRQADDGLDVEGALHPVVDIGHKERKGGAERQAAERLGMFPLLGLS